jgi:hypothetical protein
MLSPQAIPEKEVVKGNVALNVTVRTQKVTPMSGCKLRSENKAVGLFDRSN